MYSLRTTSSPAVATVSSVKMPAATSSSGASLVRSRVCGSSVCQQVASLSMPRRRRGASSAKYSRRESPREPSTAISWISRSVLQRAAIRRNLRAWRVRAQRRSPAAGMSHARGAIARVPPMTDSATQVAPIALGPGEGEALWFLGALAT